MITETTSEIYARTFNAVRAAYLAHAANPENAILKNEWLAAYRACSKAQKNFYAEQKGNVKFMGKQEDDEEDYYGSV